MVPRCDGCNELRQDITNVQKRMESQQKQIDRQQAEHNRLSKECDKKFAAGNARFDNLNEILENVNELVTSLNKAVQPFIQRERDLQGVVNFATKIKNLMLWCTGIPIGIAGTYGFVVWIKRFIESMPT